MEKIDRFFWGIWVVGLVFGPIVIIILDWLNVLKRPKNDVSFWQSYVIIFWVIWFAIGYFMSTLVKDFNLTPTQAFLLVLLVVILCLPLIGKLIDFLIELEDKLSGR